MASSTTIDASEYVFQFYESKDENLIPKFEVDSFLSSSSYIELFIYDLNKAILSEDYNYTQYTLNPNNVTTKDDLISQFNIDPIQTVENQGFSQGSYVTYYNFLTKRIGTNISLLYISEISSDRTEIRLDSNSLSKEDIIEQTNKFINFRESKDYFCDFYINFGSNELVIANNIKLENENTDDPTILIKLYEPLPPQFSIKDQLWVVTQLNPPAAYQVEFVPTPVEVIDSIALSGPNFNIPIKNQVNNSSQNLSESDILSGAPTSSLNHLKSLLDEKSINISADYSNFTDFIHFSSAKTRLENFKFKVNLLEQYSSSLENLSSTLNSSTSTLILQDKVSNVIQNFDGYERFLYFNSGSSKSWPKTNTEPPYELAKINSLEVSNWYGSDNEVSAYYGGMILSASDFDNQNPDQLLKSIPEYLREDPQNKPYELFIDMVAQYYDDIWLYTKDVTQKYNADNRLDFGISKDLVADAIKDFGLKLYQNNFSNDDLYTAFLGMTPSGSLFPFPNITSSLPAPSGFEFVDTLISASNDVISMDDTNKSLYKRLYHNIPYLLKSKGTLAGVRALITSYGIPDTILKISEFGGKDQVDANDYDYYFNNFNYAWDTEGTNNMTTLWEVNEAFTPTPDGLKPGTLELRFKTPGLPDSRVSQSLWVTTSSAGINKALVLEYTGSYFTSESYSGSITDPYYQYGNLKYISDPGGANETSCSIYLPFFDGEWWSVMVRNNGFSAFDAEYIITEPTDYDFVISEDGSTYIVRENSTTSGGSSTGNVTIFAANKIYNGNDGTKIGFTESASVNSSNVGANWFAGDNSIFAKEFTGGGTYESFSGSMQEIRYYGNALGTSRFYDYTMNPLSTRGNSVNSAPNELSFRAALGSELDLTSTLSIHPRITGSWDTIPSFASTSDFSFTNTPVYVPNTEYFFLDQPLAGIKNRITDKIRSENNTIPSGSVLSPIRSLAQTIEASASYTENINYLEAAFSPQNQINDDIIDQIGYVNIGDYIGDPRQRFSGNNYPDLDKLSKDYFQKYEKPYGLVDFVRLIKFFDNSLFKMIKDYIPTRTSLASGLVVKQHLLERNKYPQPQVSFEDKQYTGSIDMVEISGGAGGMFNIFNGVETSPFGSDGNGPNNRFFITQSWSESFDNISGSVTKIYDNQDEFYDGIFDGTVITITNGELNEDCDQFKKPDFQLDSIPYEVDFYSNYSTTDQSLWKSEPIDEGFVSFFITSSNPYPDISSPKFLEQGQNMKISAIDGDGVDHSFDGLFDIPTTLYFNYQNLSVEISAKVLVDTDRFGNTIPNPYFLLTVDNVIQGIDAFPSKSHWYRFTSALPSTGLQGSLVTSASGLIPPFFNQSTGSGLFQDEIGTSGDVPISYQGMFGGTEATASYWNGASLWWYSTEGGFQLTTFGFTKSEIDGGYYFSSGFNTFRRWFEKGTANNSTLQWNTWLYKGGVLAIQGNNSDSSLPFNSPYLGIPNFSTASMSQFSYGGFVYNYYTGDMVLNPLGSNGNRIGHSFGHVSKEEPILTQWFAYNSNLVGANAGGEGLSHPDRYISSFKIPSPNPFAPGGSITPSNSGRKPELATAGAVLKGPIGYFVQYDYGASPGFKWGEENNLQYHGYYDENGEFSLNRGNQYINPDSDGPGDSGYYAEPFSGSGFRSNFMSDDPSNGFSAKNMITPDGNDSSIGSFGILKTIQIKTANNLSNNNGSFGFARRLMAAPSNIAAGVLWAQEVGAPSAYGYAVDRLLGWDNGNGYDLFESGYNNDDFYDILGSSGNETKNGLLQSRPLDFGRTGIGNNLQSTAYRNYGQSRTLTFSTASDSAPTGTYKYPVFSFSDVGSGPTTTSSANFGSSFQLEPKAKFSGSAYRAMLNTYLPNFPIVSGSENADAYGGTGYAEYDGASNNTGAGLDQPNILYSYYPSTVKIGANFTIGAADTWIRIAGLNSSFTGSIIDFGISPGVGLATNRQSGTTPAFASPAVRGLGAFSAYPALNQSSIHAWGIPLTIDEYNCTNELGIKPMLDYTRPVDGSYFKATSLVNGANISNLYTQLYNGQYQPEGAGVLDRTENSYISNFQQPTGILKDNSGNDIKFTVYNSVTSATSEEIGDNPYNYMDVFPFNAGSSIGYIGTDNTTSGTGSFETGLETSQFLMDKISNDDKKIDIILSESIFLPPNLELIPSSESPNNNYGTRVRVTKLPNSKIPITMSARFSADDNFHVPFYDSASTGDDFYYAGSTWNGTTYDNPLTIGANLDGTTTALSQSLVNKDNTSPQDRELQEFWANPSGIKWNSNQYFSGSRSDAVFGHPQWWKFGVMPGKVYLEMYIHRKISGDDTNPVFDPPVLATSSYAYFYTKDTTYTDNYQGINGTDDDCLNINFTTPTSSQAILNQHPEAQEKTAVPTLAFTLNDYSLNSGDEISFKMYGYSYYGIYHPTNPVSDTGSSPNGLTNYSDFADYGIGNNYASVPPARVTFASSIEDVLSNELCPEAIPANMNGIVAGITIEDCRNFISVGRLSGSIAEANFRNRNQFPNYKTYSDPISLGGTITPDVGGFKNSDCDVLQGEAFNARPNPYLQDLDYAQSQVLALNYESVVSGSASRATVPESYYTSLAQINSRYLGSKNQSRLVNQYIPEDNSFPINSKISQPSPAVTLASTQSFLGMNFGFYDNFFQPNPADPINSIKPYAVVPITSGSSQNGNTGFITNARLNSEYFEVVDVDVNAQIPSDWNYSNQNAEDRFSYHKSLYSNSKIQGVKVNFDAIKQFKDDFQTVGIEVVLQGKYRVSDFESADIFAMNYYNPNSNQYTNPGDFIVSNTGSYSFAVISSSYSSSNNGDTLSYPLLPNSYYRENLLVPPNDIEFIPQSLDIKGTPEFDDTPQFFPNVLDPNGIPSNWSNPPTGMNAVLSNGTGSFPEPNDPAESFSQTYFIDLNTITENRNIIIPVLQNKGLKDGSATQTNDSIISLKNTQIYFEISNFELRLSVKDPFNSGTYGKTPSIESDDVNIYEFEYGNSTHPEIPNAGLLKTGKIIQASSTSSAKLINHSDNLSEISVRFQNPIPDITNNLWSRNDFVSQSIGDYYFTINSNNFPGSTVNLTAYSNPDVDKKPEFPGATRILTTDFGVPDKANGFSIDTVYYGYNPYSGSRLSLIEYKGNGLYNFFRTPTNDPTPITSSFIFLPDTIGNTAGNRNVNMKTSLNILKSDYTTERKVYADILYKGFSAPVIGAAQPASLPTSSITPIIDQLNAGERWFATFYLTYPNTLTESNYDRVMDNLVPLQYDNSQLGQKGVVEIVGMARGLEENIAQAGSQGMENNGLYILLKNPMNYETVQNQISGSGVLSSGSSYNKIVDNHDIENDIIDSTRYYNLPIGYILGEGGLGMVMWKALDVGKNNYVLVEDSITEGLQNGAFTGEFLADYVKQNFNSLTQDFGSNKT